MTGVQTCALPILAALRRMVQVSEPYILASAYRMVQVSKPCRYNINLTMRAYSLRNIDKTLSFNVKV